MKLTVIGGGPGGLYFSILLKKAIPSAQIDVYERNKADDSFGFGVVFSDETLSEFLTRDTGSYALIRDKFAYWDDLDVVRNGESVRISGNGFCGCSRKVLLQLLQQRCREEGISLHFEAFVQDTSQFKDSDYIIACDGINSVIRDQFASGFGTKIVLEKNKFVWLGSTKPLNAFAYFFRTTPHGTFVAHTYQYEQGMSTWVIECTEETWEKAGFETTNEADTIQKLSQIFAAALDGHSLISNKSHWRQFPTITNEHWHKDNIILLGDAKATAHFSIGSGTKMAMECAIALADAIIEHGKDKKKVVEKYGHLRRDRVNRIQRAASTSRQWFENMDCHVRRDFMQFAFGVMTRSQKVSFENLALRDPSFTQKVVREFNEKQGNNELTTPPAFTSYSIGKLKLSNRIVMAPMEQHSAEEGLVSDWHLVHYAARAIGGVGLILTESTLVSSSQLSTFPNSPGIYSEEQIRAWKQITEFIHQHSQAKIGLQLVDKGNDNDYKIATQNAAKAGFDLVVMKDTATGKYKIPDDEIINIYQDPSDDIRNIDQINTILLSGRGDLVALGKPLLLNPNFVRQAQAYEQYRTNDIPSQYEQGAVHLYAVHAAERKEKERMKKALKPITHKK